jgi:hypothetical protein
MFVQDTLVSTLGCDSHFATRVVGARDGSPSQLLIGTTLYGNLIVDAPSPENARLEAGYEFPTVDGTWFATERRAYCPACFYEHPESVRVATERDIDVLSPHVRF